jgi:acetyltransferase
MTSDKTDTAQPPRKEVVRASIKSVFEPKSVAVIGAGRSRGTIGREILHNLIEYEFNGMVFAVNPNARVIHSMKCYRSVLEIPDEVELAVICVPKQLVLQAIDDCGRKDVKGIILITAGFSETGPKGKELEDQVFRAIRRHGMRMIGPNCMGVINTAPDVRMDATFAGTLPLDGPIGFLSQSGALGVAILERSSDMNLGLSSFVSLGNKMDVSVDDVLEYWRDDERTKLVLLYIESFGDPYKFSRLAREIVKKKPIIAVKSGRSAAGARAASSHTASLAGMDVAADALFDAAGVLRVDTVEELFDLAQAFAHQPIPHGNRVAIVSNSGGPAILATDAVARMGLQIATFSNKTVASLRGLLAEEASLSNPLDMISGADHESYRQVLNTVLEDEGIDAVIVLFVQPITIDARLVAQSVVEVATKRREFGKPILCCFMGRDDDISGSRILREANLPVYIFPEAAARTLAAMNRYRDIRNRPEGVVRHFQDVDKKQVAQVFDKVMEEGRERLNDMEVRAVLEAYRFPMAPSVYVSDPDKLGKAAKTIGYPVAMKVASPKIIHKSDVGGVSLNLRNELEVLGAYARMKDLIEGMPEKVTEWGVIIQRMVDGGRELVMGSTFDPLFGPLIMVGLGGIYVEILKDITFHMLPLTDVGAAGILKNLRAYPILQGVRGEPPIHMETITEFLGRLSQLLTEFPVIREMDINPIMAFPERERCMAVDARIMIKL